MTGRDRAATGEIVGGYRLVRVLGEGSRAEIFLGHPIAGGEHASQAALKIYRPGVGFGSIEAELDALAVAAGPHVVRVLDASTGVDGAPVVVLERLGGRSLASLLAARGEVTIGEAITILVPLAGAVARLRSAGVAHGRVRADAVLFTTEGAPVLARFGAAHVTDAATTAQREATEPLAADLDGLREVARAVLAPRQPTASGSLRDVLEWLEQSTPDDTFPEELSARLFELGTAEPVALTPDHSAHDATVRSALVPSRPRSRTSVRRWTWPSPSEATAMIERMPELIAPLREAVASVRPRFWVIGIGALAALVGALVLVPQGSSDAISDAATSAPPAPSATATVSPADAIPEEILGDDPARALAALLEARELCLRSVSVLCLDAVDQVGSQALADDQARVMALQEGTDSDVDVPEDTVPPQPWEFEIGEKLGGAALVTVSGAESTPASILMIRSEAGWRIRDYLR